MAFIYVCIPLAVWFFAFVIWLYWRDLLRLAGKESEPQRPAANVNPAPSPAKRPREKILDEDRKKLEDILKRHS